MLNAALVFFALAAAGGLVLAYLYLAKKGLPIGLAIVHGLLAVTGLALLIGYLADGAAESLTTAALVIFLLAAVGGIILFTLHLSKKPLPPALIVIHGAVAVTAFVILLISQFR